MTEIKNLIEISKYAGERFDLVQAAGGNSSVKLKSDEMLIKASGFLLSDISENIGYSRVVTSSVAKIVREKKILELVDKKERELKASQFLKNSTIDKKNRPSIETLLHSLLLKYTLHTHSIVVNMIVVNKDWKETLLSVFENESVAFVDYETPGIELAISLDKELRKFKKIPKIIILQNHGLIVTSNNKNEIKKLNELVVKKIEDYLKIDMSRYKLTNHISKLFSRIGLNKNLTYLSEDDLLNKLIKDNKTLFNQIPLCPDTFVYCGEIPCFVNNLTETSQLTNYLHEYDHPPKIIIYNNKIFVRAISIKKAREIEEVLKFHIMVLLNNQEKQLNYLEKKELKYLSSWEAEKFRQNKI